MKIKIKDVELECTVDEFVKLYEAGILDDIFEQNNGTDIDEKVWEKLLEKQQDKNQHRGYDINVVPVYGCVAPNNINITQTDSTLGAIKIEPKMKDV